MPDEPAESPVNCEFVIRAMLCSSWAAPPEVPAVSSSNRTAVAHTLTAGVQATARDRGAAVGDGHPGHLEQVAGVGNEDGAAVAGPGLVDAAVPPRKVKFASETTAPMLEDESASPACDHEKAGSGWPAEVIMVVAADAPSIDTPAGSVATSAPRVST